MIFNIEEYWTIVDGFYKRMSSISDDVSSVKLSDEKWSLKEMIGHLIDSASNNHQRFVRLQLENSLDFPKYEAETWKKVQKVNTLSWKILIDTWKNYNTLLIHIISVIDEKCLQNVWLKDGEKLSLEYLVIDYFRHIKWHIDLFEERIGEITRK